MSATSAAAFAPESAPSRYFQTLADAFEEASCAAGAMRHDLDVGPLRVAMRFGGPRLEQLLAPAFEHLSAPDDGRTVDASIRVWDSESTGVRVPSFTWRTRDVAPRGEVRGYNDGRFRTIYHGDVMEHDGGFNALSMHDSVARSAIFWVQSADRIHWWERAEPLRAIMHWTLDGPGRYLAHAAAVGDERGAVLLAGRGGSGKTTTALACVEAGMTFVGENYVLVTSDPEPVVHSVYATAKLRPGTLELLPGLGTAVRTMHVAPGEKWVVDMARHRPERLASGLPLRALVVPQVTGELQTRVVRASAGEALLALAPTTVVQLPGNGGVLGSMAALAGSLPVYRLELGNDVTEGPAAIRRVLDEATRR